MFSRKELKLNAKEALKGNWGISIVLTLITLLLPTVLNFIPLIGAIIVLIITPAISYLPQEFFLRIRRTENIEIGDIFTSIFNKLGIYWGIAIRTFLKILPYWLIMMAGSFITIFTLTSSSPMVTESISFATASILSLLATILNLVGLILLCTNSLFYVLAIFIKTDEPNITCREAVLKSKELMTGHRLEYFILTLSFIGWALLGAFTFGIAFLYVLPYMFTTYATFYDELKNNNVGITNNDPIQF